MISLCLCSALLAYFFRNPLDSGIIKDNLVPVNVQTIGRSQGHHRQRPQVSLLDARHPHFGGIGHIKHIRKIDGFHRVAGFELRHIFGGFHVVGLFKGLDGGLLLHIFLGVGIVTS